MVELVCRLARTIASPHESANMVLVAEGCPGRASVLVKLAAHLCGFLVFQPSPIPSTSSFTFRMDQFKSDLVTAYTRAGTKVKCFMFFLILKNISFRVNLGTSLAIKKEKSRGNYIWSNVLMKLSFERHPAQEILAENEHFF